MSYWRFVAENRRFLAFGFLMAGFSSFGQTFFISLFSAPIRAAFALSDGEFGLLYSIANLASGFCLIWLGRKIDHLDLRLYSALVCLGIVGACLFMSSVTAVTTLGLALFLLRLTGQGLMTHVALTSMARYFESGRGKAVSIASFGFPAGEAIFPLLAVTAIAAIGWRQTWMAVGLILAVVLVPLVLWLLKGHAARHRRLLDRSRDAASDGGSAAPRNRVAADPSFYLSLPAALAPPFIMTGLFFHQVHLAQSKGWSLAWLATCFIGYAVAQGAAALQAGSLVDRIGAVRLLPFYLIPLGLALSVLSAFGHPGAALIYMVAAGVTSGMTSTTVTALWAELYGVARLGAVRSLVAALTVLASALAPASMGWLIDRGVTIETIALLCLGYVGLAVVLVLPVVRMAAGRRERAPSA